MENAEKFLLTIAIPTFNRADYLKLTLEQLNIELDKINRAEVEVVVCDNASTDNTKSVIDEIVFLGLGIRYLINPLNIGGDANIAKCYECALGKFVLVLGDDDLFVNGTLVELVNYLKTDIYSVICMKPYGYNRDFQAEYPGANGRDLTFNNPEEFLGSVGQLITLISSVVIRRKLFNDICPSNLIKSSLVQVELVISALLRSDHYLYMNRYLIACKRNNTGGYLFFEVFVKNLSEVLDKYLDSGLTLNAIKALENKMLLGHFPLYIYRLLKSKDATKIEISYNILKQRFSSRYIFILFIQPAFRLPHFLGLLWMISFVFCGRILNGDLRRGFWFLLSKFNKTYKSS